MWADPAWRAARALPKAQKRERAAAFSQLRQRYGFSEYALHEFAKGANCVWLADHIDAVTAQTLASRAYQAVNRICCGLAKKVRFRSKGRGLDSIEGKRNDTGLRFVLQPPEEGNQGWLVWGRDRIPALIDRRDPVVRHGLGQRIKYVRLVRRKASSPRARGADTQGYRYSVQLVLEGIPYQKPKHRPGADVVGLDLGPSTLAIVPREGEARLVLLCEELKPDVRKKQRLERKLDRQRRANNPEHYDEQGRIKKRGTGRLIWRNSKGYLATQRRLDHHEFSTRSTKLSQYCHGCGRYERKPLSQRWHTCPCGIGPVQRDLYAAFLATYLEAPDYRPSCARYEPYWEGAEARLRAAQERALQRAKEGQVLPRSMGMPRARARLPKSPGEPTQELVFRRGRLEAWKDRSEPPVLQPGEPSAGLAGNDLKPHTRHLA
jgi:hypothetical protein